MAIKHLYIHLPFCHQFCQYCDFLRIHYDPKHVDQYLQLIKQEIKSKHIKNKLKTIYLGGGTPNALNFAQLTELGKSVKNLIDHKTEFTIECNPEFISDEQVAIFKKIGINRVSLGTQIWDDQLLHKYGRNHTTQTVVKAVKILQSHQIKNISLDFIYGFNDLTNKQILKGILFAKTNAIKHLSFYALELKNSQLKQTNYVLNESLIEAQFKYIIKTLAKYGFMRYEVSNWCTDKQYQSQHNLAYWQTNEWYGIGWGAYGLEKRHYYVNEGSWNQWKMKSEYLSIKDYYFQILMMGLRLIDGIDLRIKKNHDAYRFYQKKLQHIKIVNHHLCAENVNVLDTILLDIL